MFDLTNDPAYLDKMAQIEPLKRKILKAHPDLSAEGALKLATKQYDEVAKNDHSTNPALAK